MFSIENCSKDSFVSPNTDSKQLYKFVQAFRESIPMMVYHWRNSIKLPINYDCPKLIVYL